MTHFRQPVSENIWNLKYRLKKFDGTTVDNSVEDTWLRIAEHLSSAEGEDIRLDHEEDFYLAMEDFKFMPAGRIVSGAGTNRNVTLFNCFVMGTIPDSLDGIFDNLKEAALTMQQGGGIGYDFSTLRPKGAHVKGVDSDASGPLTFMDVWDAMCKTIMSAGSRRGAMMATIRCDHPDVEDFVRAKRDSNRLRNFNLSVMITDKFMEAVDADGDFDLVFDGEVYKTVRARQLWETIMISTYEYAEPGVLFIDRINTMNNLKYCELIASTNPCGEQPLPPYGACLLGSVNLAMMVNKPFTKDAAIDNMRLRQTVRSAVRMMDNVVDVTKFPLPEQEAEAKAKRRIGLGVTGVGSMLTMMRLVYGSEEAQQFFDTIMGIFAEEAYQTSIDLAKEKGAFPLFDADEFLNSGYMLTQPDYIREQIRKYGIRNALLTSIAPTGTISIYANNVSSGIEPIFAFSYERKVLNNDGSHTVELVMDYALHLWRELYGDAPLPDYFVTAQTLTPQDHIRMQAVAQKHIDSSISKTTNCPEDISFDDFKDVYSMAWDTGCKGCTTYRPNDVTGSVLTAVEEDKAPTTVPSEEGAACRIEIDKDTGQMLRTCDA